VLKLPVAAGQAPVVLASAEPVITDGEYVVRPGDSIERIARRLGVHAELLASANGIRHGALIYAGQRLRVPTDGAAPEVVLAAAAPDMAAEAREAVLVETPDEPSLTAALALVDAAAGPDVLDAEAEPVASVADAADTVVEEAPDAEASLESNVLASHQAELAADPSDYAVSDGRIYVQALETLGHYADWLEIRTQRLRDLNGLAFRQNVVIGQPLRLDFSRVSAEEFERRRIAYHREIQE